MKKLLLSLLACGTVVAAQAQAGSILVFGDLGIHTTTDSSAKPTRTLAYNVSPGVGYQFNKNWTAGIYLNYESFSFKPDGGKRQGERTYGGGLFGRYTCPIGEHFFMFSQLQAGYFSTRDVVDGEGQDHTGVSGFEFGLTPAIGVNIMNGFALNFGFGGLSYMNSKHEDSDNGYSQLDFNFGQQFNVGISKNFGGHKAHKGHHGMMDDTRRVDAADDEEDTAPKKKAKKSDDDE